MSKTFLALLFSITILILICLLIVHLTNKHNRTLSNDLSQTKDMSDSSHNKHSTADIKRDFIDKQPKSYYLNYASTNMPLNGNLNPSDLAYPSVIKDRQRMLALMTSIKKYINAPPSAKVIINSGATESIANMIWWAREHIPQSLILGSTFDHKSVELNCKNQSVAYSNELIKATIPNNTSLIMLTHVDGKTGEILNVQNYITNVFDRYSFMNNEGETFTGYNIEDQEYKAKHTLAYRPILALDASQSITKIPIDMERWKLNAVFFSLHKIGGEQGLGVLVINDDVKGITPFKPLITGAQQHMLRGGTYNMKGFIDSTLDVFKNGSGTGNALRGGMLKQINDRKQDWGKYVKMFEDRGYVVQKPSGEHLYNTVLVESPVCPLVIINFLAKKGIFIGNISACENENINNRDAEKKSGDSEKKYIRLSYHDKNDLNEKVIEEVILALDLAKESMLGE